MIVLSHYNDLLDPNLLTDGTTAFISGVQRQRRERERIQYTPHKISMLNKKHTWIRKFEKDH